MSNLLPTRHSLPTTARIELIGLLNQILADLLDLFAQTKFAHWNVKGPNFIALHELFDRLAGTCLAAIDELAERAAALGGIAHGTIRQAASTSRLAELPHETLDARAILRALADRYAALAHFVREAIDRSTGLGDAITADQLTELGGQLDKALYLLEAHHAG